MVPLAQLTETIHAATDTAQRLSAQSLTVWFVLTVLLFGSGIFWVIKLLLVKWEKSEQSAAKVQQQLMEYISGDRLRMESTIRENSTVLGEVVQLLEQYERNRHDADLVKATRDATINAPHPSIQPDPRKKAT